MTIPVLEITGLKKSYGLKPILRGIDLVLQPGECVLLLGANGTGKTTLLRMLAGLSKPSAGTACINGLDVVGDAQQVRHLVGFVAHQPYLYEELTALENLLFFGRMYGVEHVQERACELLQRVGLERRMRERVATLSRGQVQRLAWARALLHRPLLLLLDEPDSGLDQEGQALIDMLLAEHIQQGGSVLLTTHQRERALRSGNQIVMLANGRIVQTDQGDREPLGDSSYSRGDPRGRPVGGDAVGGDAVHFFTPRQAMPSISQMHHLPSLQKKETHLGGGILAILWKDIRYELRSKQIWIGMGTFALLVLVIFNFAFDLRVDDKAAVAPGALWVAFLFASLLGLGRTLAAEREQGPLDRLLLCPVDRKAFYLAKLLGNVLFIGAVEIVALPIFAALFDVPLFVGALLPIVLFGTLGIATIGTLFSTMAAATRARELLLPVLVFPLLVPILIAAVRATSNLLAPSVNEPPWLGLIIAFDVIFVSVSLLTFAYIAEE
jgi:heme ABC exporter ATP-binding subunit CcmA/heme exporter protein CcmB